MCIWSLLPCLIFLFYLKRDNDLFDAAGSGNIPEVKRLLKEGARPDGHRDNWVIVYSDRPGLAKLGLASSCLIIWNILTLC